LWTVISHKSREERNTPEIQRSDLAEVVLLLHSLGIREAATFDWLDKPDTQAVERAERLLTMLGALNEADLTAIGRQMLRLPMHPRYSRMLIEASQRGCVPDAALCAALVSGRDLLARLDRDDAQTKAAREMFEESEDSDFITLMRAYDFAQANRFSFERCRGYGINAQVARQVEQTCQQILQAAHQQRLYDRGAAPASPSSDEALLRCLMAGFVDPTRQTTRTWQARVRPHRAKARPTCAGKRGPGRPVFRRRQSAGSALARPHTSHSAQPRHRREARVDRRDVSPASQHHRGASL